MDEKERQPLKERQLPFKFFLDLDSACYQASSAGEQQRYKWVKRNDKDEVLEESPEFTLAEYAEDWIISVCWEEDPYTLGWTRDKYSELKPFKEVISALKSVMSEYKRTCKKVCRSGATPVYEGFLTESGNKYRVVEGTEKRYQHNRDKVVKPLHLKRCRLYLEENWEWVRMAKNGYEADEAVVALAEQAGEDGCIVAIDKDLWQAEDTWLLDCNPREADRELQWSTGLGDVYPAKTTGGNDKVSGYGFKFLCYQAIVGDTADGFGGLPMYGAKKGVTLFDDCTTREECVQKVYKEVDKKFEKGYTCKELKAKGIKVEKGVYQYLSWDGQHLKPTRLEVANQFFFFPFMRRIGWSHFKVEDYIGDLLDE